MVIFPLKIWLVGLLLHGCMCGSLVAMQEAAQKKFMVKLEAHDFNGVKEVVESGYIDDVRLFEGFLKVGDLKRKRTIDGSVYNALTCIEKYLASMTKDKLLDYRKQAQARASAAQSLAVSVTMEVLDQSSASATQSSSMSAALAARAQVPLDSILNEVLGRYRDEQAVVTLEASAADHSAATAAETAPLPRSILSASTTSSEEHGEHKSCDAAAHQTETSPSMSMDSSPATVPISSVVPEPVTVSLRQQYTSCYAFLWAFLMMLLPQRCG